MPGRMKEGGFSLPLQRTAHSGHFIEFVENINSDLFSMRKFLATPHLEVISMQIVSIQFQRHPYNLCRSIK
jgi:hypothetical protein